MSEPCSVCGPVLSATVVLVVVWVMLMAFALVRLRRLPLEAMTTDMLGVMFYGWAVAGAVTLGISVVGVLLPELFSFLEFDITSVYLAGFLGAATLLWWTVTRFWREINRLLGGKVAPETETKMPSGWTGGDPTVIAQDWVAAKIRPLVVEHWAIGSPSEDEQGRVVVNGSAILKLSSGLPYRFFRVVMTKGGEIAYDESYVGTEPR